jgi:hypothetical protein
MNKKRKINVKRDNFSHITPPEGSKIIPLTQGKYALVDEEDYEKVNEYHWTFKKNKKQEYAINGNTRLHRFILNESNPKNIIDHKNGNGLDNRKNNIRAATINENNFNTKLRVNSKIAYKGVTFNEKSKKYRSRIQFNKKGIHIGCFYNVLEAARAYDAKAEELFGEFANLNFKNEK